MRRVLSFLNVERYWISPLPFQQDASSYPKDDLHIHGSWQVEPNGGICAQYESTLLCFLFFPRRCMRTSQPSSWSKETLPSSPHDIYPPDPTKTKFASAI
jgi:hypothetical protein